MYSEDDVMLACCTGGDVLAFRVMDRDKEVARRWWFGEREREMS